MIISKILAKIVPLVMKAVWKQILPELRPLQKYANEPNETDIKVNQHDDEIASLKKDNIAMKKIIKKIGGKKITDDKKWYDD